MLKHFHIQAAQVLVVCAFFCAAAVIPATARSALTDEEGVLQYVPDETPYIFASGTPIAFDTNGTVRDARGFTSSM